MEACSDILISLERRFSTQLLTGRKRVELRKRPINVASGTRIWFYSKVPCGAVEGFGIVKKVVIGAPDLIWKLYGAVSGITREEFNEYFKGYVSACAILFKRVVRLKRTVSLKQLRQERRSFQPPQFFKRLGSQSPEFRTLNRQLIGA